jgi:putative acetyltransferase
MVDALEAAGHVRASIVAEVDGRVVGHVMLSHSWLDSRPRLVDVLVLSPLSVTPTAQGRGLGTALLSAAVAEAGRLGAPAVFLEGSPGFYSKRGWVAGAERGFTAPSARIPGPAFQVQVLDGWQSWMTGGLVYVEAFWTQDCVGLRDPMLAEVEQMFDS